MNHFKNISSRIVLGILWLLLSVSLGTWWALVAMKQATYIAQLQNSKEGLEFFQKQQRMIKFEGAFFLSLLATGGLSLIIMSVRDIKRNQMIKDFFATVTHEMKTPLASLKLQAESLEEMLTENEEKKYLHRLIENATRLELQMDKALYLASISRKESLFLEKTKIESIINPFLNYYQNLELIIESSDFISCDKRALESIFKNLIENSYHHGEATKIKIQIQKNQERLIIQIIDNGIGFYGNRSKIGSLFFKHNSRSGSGLGLYLAKNLLNKMNASISYPNVSNGFIVNISFPIAKG
jgi:signal transduction histidine kinase